MIVNHLHKIVVEQGIFVILVTCYEMRLDCTERWNREKKLWITIKVNEFLSTSLS